MSRSRHSAFAAASPPAPPATLPNQQHMPNLLAMLHSAVAHMAAQSSLDPQIGLEVYNAPRRPSQGSSCDSDLISALMGQSTAERAISAPKPASKATPKPLAILPPSGADEAAPPAPPALPALPAPPPVPKSHGATGAEDLVGALEAIAAGAKGRPLAKKAGAKAIATPPAVPKKAGAKATVKQPAVPMKACADGARKRPAAAMGKTVPMAKPKGAIWAKAKPGGRLGCSKCRYLANGCSSCRA